MSIQMSTNNAITTKTNSTTGKNSSSLSSSLSSSNTIFDSKHIDYMSNNWITISLSSTTFIVFSYVSYKLYTSIQQYGVDGTIRYIWEGTPYSEPIQECLHQIEDIIYKRNRLIIQIDNLEKGLSQAKLESVTNLDTSSEYILQLWKKYIPKTYSDLRQRLSLVSSDIDTITSMIDSIHIPSSTSTSSSNSTTTTTSTKNSSFLTGGSHIKNIESDLRQQKKLLSSELVLLMERIDILITYFKRITSTSTK